MNHNRSLDTLDHWIPGSRTYEWTVYRHDDPKVPKPRTRDIENDYDFPSGIWQFNLERSAEGKFTSSDASTATIESLPAWHYWSKQGGWRMLEAMVEEFRQTGKSSRYERTDDG